MDNMTKLILPVITFLLPWTALAKPYSHPFSTRGQSKGDDIGVTISATLSQSNTSSSSCALSLTNTSPNQIQILKHNSFLDPRTEFHSFTVTVPGGGKTLPPSSQMIRKFYDPAVASAHVVKLAPNETWSGTFDLSSIFDVLSTGEYTVSFTSHLIGFDESSKKVRINVTSSPVTISLSASKAPIVSRFGKRDAINGCDAAQNWVLRTALKSAIQMASDAHDNTPLGPTNPGVAPWYPQYFNDKSWQTVREAFGGISGYNIDGKAGVTWFCAPNCEPGTFATASPPGVNPGDIGLCNMFFTSTWASTACGVPGEQNPSVGTVSQWQTPYDQPGAILHELLHLESITATPNIHDGPGFPEDQNRYSYDSVIDLAVNAATNGDAPLQNSNNFLYYAMTIRNHLNPSASCAGCHLIPPPATCSQSPKSIACVPC